MDDDHFELDRLGYSRCSSGKTHLCTLTCSRRPRDWFRLRYWLRCWLCDLRMGPYIDNNEACRALEWIWDLERAHH